MWDSVKFWLAKELASLLWLLIIVGVIVAVIVAHDVWVTLRRKFKRPRSAP